MPGTDIQIAIIPATVVLAKFLTTLPKFCTHNSAWATPKNLLK